MEKSQELINSANNRFSDIIIDGFKLFFHNYRIIILPLAFFQVLLIILDILVLTDLRWYVDSLSINISEIMEKFLDNITLTESEWNLLATFLLMNIAIIFLENLIGAIIITIAMCSVSNYLYNKYLRIEKPFYDSFKSAFNKKIFLVIFIIGICIPLGSLLLFIPAIIIFGFFIFSVFTYNIEGIEKPLSEARRIAKGNFWKILIMFAFNFILIFIFSFIYNTVIDIFLDLNSDSFFYNYNSWLAPKTRNYGMIILYKILVNLIDIIFAPLFICLLTSLFVSLKAKKELGYGFGRQLLRTMEQHKSIASQHRKSTQNLDESLDEDSKMALQLEHRFYCPFCGNEISTPKRFCPNCGQSLSFINK